MSTATAIGHQQTWPPEPAGAREPVPVLRLYTERAWLGEPSQIREVAVPVISLRFDYEGRLVRSQQRVFEREEPAEPWRNMQAERRAAQRIERLGAVDVTCLDECPLSLDSEADYLVRADDWLTGDTNADVWCSFTALLLQELATHGFRLTIAQDYPYQVVDPAAPWYAELRPPAPSELPTRTDALDWFGLELGVMVDGSPINLLPALLELLESLALGTPLERITRSSARFRALRVDAQRYVVVPPERLSLILGVLLDLYDERRPDGALFTFPRLLTGEVARLGELLKRPIEAPGQLPGDPAHASSPPLNQGDPDAEGEPACFALLRPYQRQGVSWLNSLGARGAGGILADDMGLGKTLQTIAHLALCKRNDQLKRPAFIVMPTSLVGNWRSELLRFAPELRVTVVYGSHRRDAYRRIDTSDVVLTTYPVLLRDEPLFAEHRFSLLILDEAQVIKNAESRVARAARAIHAERRLCLSGTPLENHLGELWSLFEFLMPGFLGTRRAFQQFFREPIEKAQNATRLASLQRRIAPYLLRRTKGAVLAELPRKTEIVRSVQLMTSQRDLYEGIRVAAHSQVRRMIRERGFAGSTVAILDALMKLRQVCCDPRLVNVASAREVKESAKFSHLMELVPRLLAQGHRLLLFSQFTQMLALIAQGFAERDISFVELNGGTIDRQTPIHTFERGKADVFLISLKAGGTGLNLTSADAIIHYDPWWNPAAQAQATDRAHRIGQTRPVFVFNLVVVGSVEERMLELQQRKRQLSDAILGAHQSAELELTEHEVESLFAPIGS